MSKKVLIPLLISSTIFGAGYHIPNNSINSFALSTANIANAHGADSAYYNPANMLHNEDAHEMEVSISYIYLEPINYDSADATIHIKSKTNEAYIPTLHYVSDKLSDSGVRVGFSMVSPAGLTREWDQSPASATSKRQSLETMEFNPSIAIPIDDKLSLGLGFRYVRARGEIILDGGAFYTANVKGRTDAFGYNFALAYQASDALNISITYRSKIILDLQGDALTTLGGATILSRASTSVPIPANLMVGIAYTFDSDTTLEVTYDRAMWSAVTEANYDFDNPILEATLGVSSPQKWHDTTAYRIGVTQEYSLLTLMAGFSYETNTADDAYVSFGSPESNSQTYSLGARYTFSDDFDMGIAGMLAPCEERTVYQPTDPLGINGTLGSRNIYTLTLGAGFRF